MLCPRRADGNGTVDTARGMLQQGRRQTGLYESVPPGRRWECLLTY